MVVRAYATLGVGDAFEGPAYGAIAALDALTEDGEPILSAHRMADDQSWLIDILFAHTDAAGRARFLAAAREMVPSLPAFQIDPVAERDWVAESQKALHPIRAGRFIVHGSHDSHRLLPSRWRLLIDAGRAFGTAHHASTKGCLMALERRAKKGALGRVADVGTGTGVLALAAERLGATSIVAGDMDPEAVAVARTNITANRVCRPIPCHVAAGPVAAADVVIANILARPLLAMATPLAASAGNTLILSGLRISHARPVLAAYGARGFHKAASVIIEDWITLTLHRRSGTPTRPHRAPAWAHLDGAGW